MTNPQTYNPNVIFEQTETKGGTCTIEQVQFDLLAATNNQEVISATALKNIRVISANHVSAGIASDLVYKSATGGTRKYVLRVPINTSSSPNVTLPEAMTGHFETETGQGLFVDNVGAVVVSISLRYIKYAP